MSKHHYIEVKNLVKNYGTGNTIVNAVDHVSFFVDKGEFIGIMGTSGKIRAELNRGNRSKRDYLNRILDIQSQIGGEDIYAE